MASPGGSDGAMTQLSNSSSRDVTMTYKLENAKSLTMQELQEITDNFSRARQIGQGTYGKVFKGALDNGEEIAVKLLHPNMLEPNDGQFRQEFENLMRLEHPNIVRFVGYCYETQHKPMQFVGETFFAEQISKALCFEYMPNGSLEKHLSEEFYGLDWHARYKIIKGTCEGLKYLHEGFKEPMYHLDLKPDNILLDDNMDPKLADFGLSRLFGGQQTMSTQSTFGTIGYMPPEYLFGHVVSKKFDIFSLGVVMTKIIAGPRGHTRAAEMPRQEFLDQVQENWWSRLQATWSSPGLLKAHSEQVKICTEIALSCMEMDRHKRPSIVDIIHQLNDSEVVIDEALSLSASCHSWMREDLVKLKAFTRSEVIPGGETCNEFPILVRVTAPPWCDTPHIGVDTVAVLDLKDHYLGGVDILDAMKILINKLGRHDRLAMVSTEGHTRLTELTYMSDHGRDIARLKILGLGNNTNWKDIVASLREGAKILRGREMGKSRVGCIMVLTSREHLSDMKEIVPDHTFEFPVHILGMGHHFYGETAYHPRLLKAIADMLCGTFSFFHNVKFMAEAFEMFISCLRKLAATSIKITLVAQEGVTISSIESGGYQHHVSSDKQSGEIDMNNIYAGAQKNFIVYLTVGESNEKLLTIGGRFQSRNNENRQLADMAVFVLRPRPRSACSPEKLSMHREVAAELTRTQLVKGISAMIESQKDWYYNSLTGDDFKVLWETVRSSDEAHSTPEKTLLDLGKDIEEMTKFTGNGPYNTNEMYYMLSWLSSHEWQSATAKGKFYETHLGHFFNVLQEIRIPESNDEIIDVPA